MDQTIQDVLDLFIEKRYHLEQLVAGVTTFFQKNEKVSPFVHTIKSRIKDPSHLVDKIE